MWQAVVSDTTSQPQHPQVQTNRWKWVSVNKEVREAALLPLGSHRGQAVGTDGVHTKKGSIFLHQKIMARRMDAEC